MSGAVLVALIFIGLGVVAAMTRHRWDASRRTEAHRRALATMGRLAAQQSHPPAEVAPENLTGHENWNGQAHVRLVHRDAALVPVPTPPRRRAVPHADQSGDDVVPAPPVLQPVRVAPTVSAAALAAPLSAVRDRTVRMGRRRPARRPRLGLSAIGILAAALLVMGTVAGVALGQYDGSRSTGRHKSPTATASRPAPPVTYPAPAATPVLVTSATGYSEYRISGSAAIVIAATGTCWIEIRQSGPAGLVLFEGDLIAGDTHDIAGFTWVRLGDPTEVKVTVNGDAIATPSLVAGDPYNLQFD